MNLRKLLFIALCLTFATGLSAAEIPLATGGNIQDAITNATAGDMIILEDGGSYNGDEIVIDKTIGIKAADGAAVRPKMTLTKGFALNGGQGYNIEIQGIEVEGTGEGTDSDYFIRMATDGDSLGYLKLIDLIVHDFERTVLRIDKGGSHLDTVIIADCHFYNFHTGGWNGFYWRDERVITRYLSITETTLDGFNEGFLRFDGEFEKTIIIDKCTINGKKNKYSYPLFDIEGTAGSSFTLTNTIITDIDTIDGTTVFDIDEPVDDTIMNCRFFFDETIADTSNIWNTRSEFTKEDPQYTDAANHDLTLPAGSPLLTAGTDGGPIGDPRWVPDATGAMLLAYYKFDDNLNDDSGNGNHGTKVGDPDFVDGVVGKALNFHGVVGNDAVATGIEFTPAGSFSISLLFKVNEWDSKFGNVLIGDRGDNNADGNNFGFQVRQFAENATDESGWLCFTSRGVATDSDFDPRNGEESTVIKYPSDMPCMKAIYPNDGWQHLVCVYDKDAGKKQIYLNNNLVVDGTILIDATYPGYLPAAEYDKIMIGARNDDDKTSDNPEKSFNGALDEVMIYEGALNAGDVKALFDTYVIVQKGLVAHWKFDENSGLTAADELGTSDGSLTNMTGSEWIAGQDGNAIDMMAGNDSSHVLVPDNDVVDFDSTTSFTISALVKVDPISYTDEINIVFKGRTGVDVTQGWEGKWYTLAFKGQELRLAVDDNINKSQLGVNIASIYPVDQWAHIVGVRDLVSDSLKLYLNGAMIGSMADGTDSDIASGNLPLIIGNNQNQDRNFKGQIDDLRMYNEALSADEIQTLFESYNIETGIENETKTLVSQYHLAQNYPNPFNPVTRLSFHIKEAGQVTLSVYNTLGQKIMTPVNERMEAGHHSLTLNMQNQPSGIYFYRIESADFTTVKKMILMK